MRNIAIVGAGTMGNGIAHVFALHNYKVTLVDQSRKSIETAKETIKLNLERQIKKNVISIIEKENTLRNLSFSSDINTIDPNIDILIEAIFEDKSAKLDLYKDILKRIDNHTILATNTSSISITELAPKDSADRFIGMHFMNPVPVIPLVEIVKGYSTSAITVQTIIETVKQIGKIPIEVSDSPGFISNRILMPMINEAIFVLQEGIAGPNEIDSIMKLGMNHPMGPLTLADFIGLDVCLNIMEVLFDGFGDTKYRPCLLLKKMVAAGKLGKKTGAGFYEYPT